MVEQILDLGTNFKLCLILVIGIPACGKSTLIKQFRESIIQTNIELEVNLVTLDEIQKDMDALDIEGWHKSRDVALEITRTMIEKCLMYKKQSLVIVDDTFEYASMRKAYY